MPCVMKALISKALSPTQSEKLVLSPDILYRLFLGDKNYKIFSSLGDRKEAISCSIRNVAFGEQK